MKENEKINLLRRASADFAVASLILSSEPSDNVQLDIAAYHLQQAVEKLLKHEMAENGVKFPFVHEIDILCDEMEEAGLSPPEWVRQSEDLLNSYATKTESHNALVASKSKLNNLMPLVDAYLQQQIQKEQEQTKKP